MFYIKRLAEVLETTGNYIIGISDTGLSHDALMVATAFESLDPQGQTIIKALLDMEAGRTEAIRAQIWREVEERGYRIEAANEEQAEA